MPCRIRALTVGALFTAAVVAAVLLTGIAGLNVAVSDDRRDDEVDVRVQARLTDSGRVEVRAQSYAGANEWMTHTPEARFLPTEPEIGRWYSSSTVAVRAPAAAPDTSDVASYTRAFVQQAIDRYERDGREATLQYYNSADSFDGPWYVFIIDEDGMLIANRNPEMVGIPASDVDGPDGYPAGRMVLAVASVDGAWVDYQFINPLTGRAEIKHSWIVRHDGLIFGSGWYEDAPSKVHAPGAYTQSFVERALEMHRVLGREATLEYYNSPDSTDGPWYVFILDDRDGALYTIAHAALPHLVGTTRERIDASGFDYGEGLRGSDGGGWRRMGQLSVHPPTDARGRAQTHMDRAARKPPVRRRLV